MSSSLQVHLEVTFVRPFVAQSGHGSEEVSTLELHCLEMGAHSRLQRGRDHKQKQQTFRPMSGLGDIGLIFCLKVFVSFSLDLFCYFCLFFLCLLTFSDLYMMNPEGSGSDAALSIIFKKQ